MPYRIGGQGGKYHVINKETGKDKGASESREKAVALIGLLYNVKHGMKPPPKKQLGVFTFEVGRKPHKVRRIFLSKGAKRFSILRYYLMDVVDGMVGFGGNNGG